MNTSKKRWAKRSIVSFVIAAMAMALIPFSGLNLKTTEAAVSDDAPAFTKELYPNGDGTYALVLSVTGEKEHSSQEEVTKANVILVLDTSSSMNHDAGDTYYEVYGTPGDPADEGNTSTNYYRKTGDGANDYARVYYRNGSWYTSQNGSTEFTGTFYARTRFWAEKHALTDDEGIIDKLLAQNTEQHPDVIDIAIVSFGRTGEPIQGFSHNATTLKNAINGLTTSPGTNWDEGLTEAYNYASAIPEAQKDEAVYILFLTDGQPSTYSGSYESQGTTTLWNNAWDHAIEPAHKLVEAGYKFYALFTWGDSDMEHYLTSLVGYAYTGTGTYDSGVQGYGEYYDKTDSIDALVAKLKQIVDTITQDVGYTSVGMTDSVTSMTNTNMKTSVDGDISGIKYYRSGGTDNQYGTADPANGNYGTLWEDAPTASMNNGAIDWELGSNFILEDEVTYTMVIEVWPSQESLDLVADLNNGVKKYDSLTQAQKDQIVQVGEGHYSLKTNKDNPTISYKTITTVTDSSGTTQQISDLKTATIDNPDPVGLTESKLNAVKKWQDDLAPDEREGIDDVTLYLLRGDEYYFIQEDGTPIGVKLLESENWTKSNYIAIAPGLLVDENSPAYDPNADIKVTWEGKTYVLLEEGHDYVFEESAIDHHYELTAYIHHPMIMGQNDDGTPKVVDVTFTKDSSGKITGIEKIVELEDSLSATNTMKPGINIQKVVVDESGEIIDNTDPFEVTVYLCDEDGNPLPNKLNDNGDTFNFDYRIYYGENNPKYDNPDEGTSQKDIDLHRTGHIYKTGTSFTETLYVGDVIRVVNVEAGALFRVEETESTGYVLDSVAYEISRHSATDYVAYTSDEAVSLNGNTYYVTEGDSASQATLKNKYTYGDLEVSKTVTVTSGNADQAKAKEFEFTFKLFDRAPADTDTDTNKPVELTGLKYNYTITPAQGNQTTGTITEGGTFKLKDGDKILIEKLPEAAYYEVVETELAGFATTATGDTGSIEKNKTAEAKFTNTYSVKPVKVNPPVKKDITGNDDLYNNGAFEFKIANTEAPTGVTAPMPTVTGEGDQPQTVTTIYNKADYEIANKKGYYEFGEIEFTAPGKYVYTVTESGSVTGVTNDAEATKKLEFTVSDNGKGELTVTAPDTASAVFSFTNVYKSGGLNIEKTVVNAADPEDDTKFTFKVTFRDATDAAVEGSFPYTIGETKGTIASGGTLQLANGEKAQITGIPNGVKYTVEEQEATGYELTSKSGVSGTIDADADTVPTAQFENTYKADGEAIITVNKAISGAEWPAGKKLTLTLAGSGGTLPEEKTATLTEAGKATFGKITYTQADANKTYTYTISEDGFGTGWTGSGDVTATVKVTDNGNGTLSTEVTYSPKDATITNTYEAKGSIELEAIKVLEGRDWMDGETFTFTLLDKNGEVYDTQTVSKDNAASVKFKALNYTQDDVGKEDLKYTISETGTLPAGVEKSDDITAIVTVKDNGNGSLDVSAEYTQDDTIINTYTADPVKAQINVNKTIEGYIEGADAQFDFTLTPVKDAPMPEGKETLTGSITTAEGKGSLAFDEITYDTVGDYQYEVVESKGDKAGFTYDTTTYTVTVTISDNPETAKLEASVKYEKETAKAVEVINKFAETGTSVVLHVDKVIDDQSGSAKDATFTFQLKDSEGTVLQTKEITTEELTGGVDFDELTFDESGTYNFIIVETGTAPNGWTYDTKEYPVVVEVTDNFDTAVLEQTTTIDGKDTTSLTVTNKYDPKDAEVTLQARKVVEDPSKSAPSETFSFQLLDSEGAVVETVTKENAGYVNFSKLTFAKVDTYEYTIQEVAGSTTGFSYDTKARKVQIKVEDAGDGTLTGKVTYLTDEGEAVITNVYTAEPVIVDPPVQKIFSGKDAEKLYNNGAFTFTIENISAPSGVPAPMPENTSITNSAEYELADKPGFYEFGEIEFTVAGTYVYKVTESGSVANVTNDPDAVTGKTITFVVTGDGKGGLKVTPSTDEVQLSFTNTYQEEPKTGDHTNFMIYLILMFLAVGIGATSLILMKESRKKN